MDSTGVLTKEYIKQLRTKFYAEPKNILAQNVCVKVDPNDAALSRKTVETTNHVFSQKVDPEGKPFTNQKSSGRCWLFAALNIMRIPFMKQYNIEEFEFSQSYLFFWDVLEKCNYFLHNIIQQGPYEKAEDRLMSFWLKDPLEDGGQWDMLTNLINRYGLMPKSCFPESFNSETTSRMNTLLRSKLREFAMVLMNEIKLGRIEGELNLKAAEQMETIYRIVGICLGIPPETITFEYYDKSKAYHSIGPVTGKEFYETYVKPYVNVDDKVCLVTDPRPLNSYNKLYTIQYLGNMVGGAPVLYNNQPSQLLLDLCVASIKNNEPVWFGCEVLKRANTKLGILDNELHDYPTLFGTDFQLTMPKAERLRYGESSMTHAMVFTGITCDKDEKVKKLRIENTWGDDRGDKGYFICSADWFHEFGFEVVVDKKYVPAEVLEVFKQKPIILPAWDPMGTLAR